MGGNRDITRGKAQMNLRKQHSPTKKKRTSTIEAMEAVNSETSTYSGASVVASTPSPASQSVSSSNCEEGDAEQPARNDMPMLQLSLSEVSNISLSDPSTGGTPASIESEVTLQNSRSTSPIKSEIDLKTSPKVRSLSKMGNSKSDTKLRRKQTKLKFPDTPQLPFITA